MRPLRTLALAILLAFALGRPAAADSFLTSVSTGSKTAARVGPAPYGASYAPVKGNIATRALTTIKSTRNVAIGLDVIQRVDSAAMSDPTIAKEFRRGLAKLARSGDPVFQVLRGVNLVMQNPSSRRGIAAVRRAAEKLPYDSAAQLVAGLAVAQRDAFTGVGSGGLAPDRGDRWDTRTPLKKESAGYLNRARSLEKGAAHPRPLVREGLRQATVERQPYAPKAKGYFGLYKGYNGLIRRK